MAKFAPMAFAWSAWLISRRGNIGGMFPRAFLGFDVDNYQLSGVWSAPFAVRDAASDGAWVFNAGPGVAEFSETDTATLPRFAVDPGASVFIPIPGQFQIYARGSAAKIRIQQVTV